MCCYWTILGDTLDILCFFCTQVWVFWENLCSSCLLVGINLCICNVRSSLCFHTITSTSFAQCQHTQKTKWIGGLKNHDVGWKSCPITFDFLVDESFLTLSFLSVINGGGLSYPQCLLYAMLCSTFMVSFSTLKSFFPQLNSFMLKFSIISLHCIITYIQDLLPCRYDSLF